MQNKHKSTTNLISAVIITFNEEKNIGACLQALHDVADEIIVVDSFSTDKTEDICKSFNVRFLQRKWEGYSATKNWGNAQAANDWILSIDADEVLSPQLQQSILQAKNDSHKTYSFNRLTNYCGKWIKHGGWYPDKKIRLFDRRTTQWEGDFVHEKLHIHSSEKILHLNGDCLHYSYHTIADHITQINRYSTLSAQQLFNSGRTANIFQLLFKPLSIFFKMYIWKLGLLDGRHGFIIAKISAMERFVRYAKLWQLSAGAKNNSGK